MKENLYGNHLNWSVPPSLLTLILDVNTIQLHDVSQHRLLRHVDTISNHAYIRATKLALMSFLPDASQCAKKKRPASASPSNVGIVVRITSTLSLGSDPGVFGRTATRENDLRLWVQEENRFNGLTSRICPF